MAGIPSITQDSLGGLYNRVAKSVSVSSGNVIAGAVQSRTGIDVRSIGGTARKIEEAARRAISGAIGGNISVFDSHPSWGNLSPHLIANFYPMKFNDKLEAVAIPDAEIVRCPITDSNFDMSFNWSSPFENSGMESKAPNMMALIQSGQIGKVANALQSSGTLSQIPLFGDKLQSWGSSAVSKSNEVRDQAAGRTGITRINSRQVFSGMPPVKLTMTLHFRALQDARQEVLSPYQQILRWAVPEQLADDGYFAELTKGALADNVDFVKTLFPSKAPTLVGMRYGINSYSPMVIESIGNPVDGQIDSDGYPIYRAVQITLATLTALDQSDVQKLFLR